MIRCVILFFFGVLLFSCGKKNQNTQGKSGAKGPLPVEFHVVKEASVNEMIEVAGTLMANEAAEMYAEISGRITQLNVDEGKKVKKGALLMKIFDDDLQAQLRKLEAEEKILASQENRQSALLKVQGISQSDYEVALNNLNNNRAEQEIIKAQIRKTEVRAPFDGVIGLRNISPGAVINQNQLLFSIVDDAKLKLDFSVPERYQSVINKDVQISFVARGISDTLTANIYAIEPTVNPENRNIRIRALFNNSSFKIMPGTFANVYLTLQTRDSAIKVPTQAAIPDARNFKIAVIKNNKAEIRKIKTGYRDRDNMEVLEGLAPGDSIVTSGIMQLRPGMELKPVFKNRSVTGA
ncbi:MAG: efflux RND transporter periplasmic adaptor subunit [Flavobacteriales bacterium]